MAMLTMALRYLRLLWDTLACALAVPAGRVLPNLRVPPKDLKGNIAIVTGANSGIGYQLALDLAKQGATVFMACRNLVKAEEARQSIVDTISSSELNAESRSQLVERLKVLELDTSLLSSVRAFAQTWQKTQGSHHIDLLFHNAGITSANNQPMTSEGLGTIYTTNFLGSFVLTHLLEVSLAPDARVILTSSMAQCFSSIDSILSKPRGLPEAGTTKPDSLHYSDTKLIQIAFAHLLQQRWDRSSGEDGSRKTVHAFSPGYTSTPIFDKIAAMPFYKDPLFWLVKAAANFSIPVQEGAATGLWLGTVDDDSIVMAGGGFWDRMVKRATVVDIASDEMMEKLWRSWERDGDVKWK